MIEAYPLSWPAGWPRTPDAKREHGRFNRKEVVTSTTASSWSRSRDLTIADGVHRVRLALERLGAARESVIISTNAVTRIDGLPRSGAREPEDPGVAVYWQIPPEPETDCMAIDRYRRLADNLAALAATVEAMRAIERHGGAAILRRAFQGFRALPASTADGMNIESAWMVLSLWARVTEPAAGNRTAAEANRLLRVARFNTHPDRGGDVEHFHLVQRAGETLRAYFASSAR